MADEVKVKELVRLRFKTLANGGQSIILDFFVNGSRQRETMKLYLVPEITKADRDANRETMRTANAVKSKRIVELQNNNHGFSNSNLLSKANFIDYLRYQAESYKKKGSTAYSQTISSMINYLIKYRGEEVTFQQIDKEYLLGFIAFLKKVKSTHKKPLSDSARDLYWTAVVIALNCAVKDDIIPINPAHKIQTSDKPKRVQTTREYLTLDELKLLMEKDIEVKERNSLDLKAFDQVKRAFLFSCFCGLRMSDIRALKWEQIQTTTNGELQVEMVQQKTKEVIYLPLSANAMNQLPEKGNKKRSDLVFNLPHVSTVEKHLLVWAKQAGVDKHITFHVARHTNATMMLYYGADIYTVSKLLGHTSVKTTQIYAKIVDETKRKTVNLIPNI